MKDRILWCFVLAVVALPSDLAAQVLFPGHSPERRNRTYDVIHYKLVVDFDEVAKRVNGTTSISLRPLARTLDSLELDAEEMDITSVVLANGRPLRFTNRSPKLAVFFDTSLLVQDTITIAITYSCQPKNGLFFIQPDSTNPLLHRQIWSQGEDTDNHFWFPCYDYPNDKATSEVIATVRDSFVLLSNGKLLGTHHDAVKGTATFHWFESKPHSSYLIMIAAGAYTIVRDTCSTVPLEYYVYKDAAEDGVRSLAKTPDAMKFFERKIGIPYPWEKYAQVWISNFMWGGMENTSAVTMNDVAYLLDKRAMVDFSSEDVVAHELAHQWWGDLVTSRDWSNLWLHEGFANYFEALFKLDQKGNDYFQYDLMQQANSVIRTEDAYGRAPLVGKDGYTANVYSKGCWVLHMMRDVLGDDAFWRAIRYFGKQYSFKNADSYEFMLAIEDATGQNLDWFFDQWVYKAGHPKLAITRSWDEDSRILNLKLDQTQVVDTLTGLFRFPLRIECMTSGGLKDTTFLVEEKEQRLKIPLPESPQMVIVDKGKNLLASFDMDRSKEEWIYLLGHSTDIADRIDAAKHLQEDNDNEAVFNALREAALNDGFWAVRNQAVHALSTSDFPKATKTLLEAYMDVHSTVRASAISGLRHFPCDSVADFVVNAALRDSSLLVLSSCLRVLSVIDSSRGFDMAARNVGVDSYRNLIRHAALEAMVSLKDVRAIPFAMQYSEIANPIDIRRLSVQLLAEVGRNSKEARMRMMNLLNDWNNTIRKATAEGLSTWEYPDVKAALNQRKLVEKDEIVVKAIEDAIATQAGRLRGPVGK